MSTLLHIGCGEPGKATPTRFHHMNELRMDIDASVKPDIVGDIRSIDMPSASVDAVYASHVLEHLERWDVQPALRECFRVLRPGGEAIFVTPDLAAWCIEIVTQPALVEHIGAVAKYRAPVTMLDALFGFGPDVEAGHDAMRHRTGFTRESLALHLAAVGFQGHVGAQELQLCAVVTKPSDDGANVRIDGGQDAKEN